jgi:hypothetical protein
MRAARAAIALAGLVLVQGAVQPVRPGPAIYSSDSADCWNRVFALLFTRTISATKTNELSGAGALVPLPDYMPPYLRLRVSTQTFDVHEDGDRALEALYPSFITRRGTAYVLQEPARTELARALTDALAERTTRSALDRALMQADLWSAFDALTAIVSADHEDPSRRGTAGTLTPLLAQLIGKLALTDGEIASLPDDYAAARRESGLPDLFAPDGEWMEVVMAPQREHDRAADFRRSSRVFVKPLRRSEPESEILAALERNDAAPHLAAAALLMETLLVDARGRVVPGRLVSDVQIRSFVRDAQGSLRGVDIDEFELSRRQARANSARAFVHLASTAPAYLALAGNDYGFATPARNRRGETAPILGTLHSRCAMCHGPDGAAFMTFGLIPGPHGELPPVIRLRQPNDARARLVAAVKEERDDFKRLTAAAGLRR